MRKNLIFTFSFLCLLILHPMAQKSGSTSTSPTPASTSAAPITAILGAFGPEIDLLLEKIDHKQELTIEHIRFTEGFLNGRKVVAALTGVGKVNAAITTTLMIEHFHPAQVLFSGIAGGVDPSLSPGDLVIGKTVAYHDYGSYTDRDYGSYTDSLVISPTRNPVTGNQNPLYFPCNAGLVQLAEEVSHKITLDSPKKGHPTPRIVTGTIVTGDTFISSRPFTRHLRQQMTAAATDMEGAAVGQTCWQQELPFLVVRCLSDDSDSNAERDETTFYRVAAHNAATLVIAITGQIALAKQ